MKSKDVKVIRLEGSEIFKEMNGWNIDKKYKTVLPYSLIVAKLNRLNVKIKDNKNNDIIGVNFNYGYDTNRLRKIRVIIKKQKAKLSDYRKSIEGNKDIDSKVKSNTIAKYNNRIDKFKELEKQEKKDWNKDNIRRKLYNEGFTLTFKRMEKGQEIVEKKSYRFWFRTAGKSRVGDTLFLSEDIYDSVVRWQDMGLILPQGKTKVVEFQAYRALIASGIENTLEFNTKHLLVVDDLTSYMNTDIISVEINDKGECVAIPRKDNVKNTLWDGMALLDEEYFADGDNYYLLRQHFFKTCAFNTKVVQFFKDKYGDDYETATVVDRYGNNVRVKNIRMLTTENSCKFEKFAECGVVGKDGIEITSKKQMFGYWKQRAKEDRYLFGICKRNHVSKFGNVQRMSYQHINTLLASKNQTKQIAQYTVDYIENLKDSDEAFIDMLKDTATEGNNNNLVIALYNKNPLFKECDFYKTFKTETISSLKKRAKQGKIFVEGDNLTACGNPYLLLLHSCGEVPYNKENGTLDPSYRDETLPVYSNSISCYTERFNDGEYISLFRNPHNAPNNIAYAKVTRHELIEKYFNLGQNVIALNCIVTEIQDLCNGADFDSDFLLGTNDTVAVNSGKKVFRKKSFACIVNNIPQDKKEWENNNGSIAEIDCLLAKSKNDIGITSNLAMLALSYFQHESNSTDKQKHQSTKELRDVVAIMSVLAQVSIDNAKRKSAVDLEKEISRIKKLDCLKKYKNLLPQWLKEVKKKVNNRNLTDTNCTMEYLQQAISKIKNISNNVENISAVDLLQDIIMNGSTNYEQIEKIKKLVADYDNVVKKAKELASKHGWKEERIEEEIRDSRDMTISRIGGMKLTTETMFYLVKKSIVEDTEETDNQKKSDLKKCKRKMLNVLYNTHTELFLSVWK